MKETNTDPLGFYESWLKSLRAGQEQMMKATSLGALDPKDAWKQWFDATMDTWRKAAGTGTDPLGLSAQWLKMMEEVQARLLAGETLPVDPFTFMKEWYEAISDSWSRTVEGLVGSEQFLEFNKRFLESYASFSKALRRANEEYLKNLQLPSRADITHVAELIVALEEKVDRLDDTFEGFESTLSQVARGDALAGFEAHLNRVESKLDALAGNLGNLVRLEAVNGLAQRVDAIESKLDTILAALAKSRAGAHPQSAESNDTAPPKAQRKKANPQQAKGSEPETRPA